MNELTTITQRPLNAETPLAVLDAGVTPTPLFYIRSNFDTPVLDAATWRLRIEGRVRRAVELSLAELAQLPQRRVRATMECAGNGRTLMEPVPDGTPWTLGAVSTGELEGPSLADVLASAGMHEDTVELMFEGADSGEVERPDGGLEVVRFARSLPRERALDPDTIVALRMNGAPLEPAHGYPVRLFVPRWYGVASVKWLTRIVALNEPFEGHFQTRSYVWIGHPQYRSGAPVREMEVRSLITSPADGDVIGADIVVRGIAWSGYGAIERVEVSADDGATWADAQLEAAASAYEATGWSCTVNVPARDSVLVSRATDAAGRVQPLDAVWNELGYGNNAVQRVRVRGAS